MRMHQNFSFLHEKAAQTALFLSKIEFFGFRQTAEDPPPPNLRVLDAKEQVVGIQASPKHNSHHAYAPKFAMFHKKNRTI